MAAQKLTLAVRPRGKATPQHSLYAPKSNPDPGKPVKKLPEEVSLPANGPTSELYNQLALEAGTSIHRLRVTKGSDGTFVPNSKDLSINSTGLREQSTIYVKDQGPQIAWRTVFLGTQTSQPQQSPPRLPTLTANPTSRIPRPPPNPPTPLPHPPHHLPQPRSLRAPNPHLNPRDPALPKTRARNPLHPPLQLSHHAPLQHLQKQRALLAPLRPEHGLLDLPALRPLRHCIKPHDHIPRPPAIPNRRIRKSIQPHNAAESALFRGGRERDTAGSRVWTCDVSELHV